MKVNFTRILSIILAFSMILCCFSACGGKGDDETTTVPDIDFPTNPNNNGESVTDDTSIDDPSNGGSSNGGSSNLGSLGNNNYTGSNQLDIAPVNPNGSGSNSGSNSGSGLGSNGSSNLEKEFNHFLTHFDTPEERKHILSLAGYEYDAGQDIFYTHLNPWQRYFGFTDIYDEAAPITNMWYLTLKADFLYDDLLWRLQWWKGQYGVLEGAELGVYTKSPYDNSGFYKCAEDEQLLTMVLDYYHSWADYQAGNRLFTRAEQEHWWLTGFKFGMVNPEKCVVRATLYAYDDEMADGIEAALQNLTDGDNKLTNKGFVPYKKGITNKDFYIRNGNRFSVVWYEAGYLNYSDLKNGIAPENPEEDNPNVELPTTPEESTTKPTTTAPTTTKPTTTEPTTKPTTTEPVTTPTTTEPVAEPSSENEEVVA